MKTIKFNPFKIENILSKDKILGPLPTDAQIRKSFFDVAWPSAVESIFIALIVAIDMMMVGTLGKEAVSAIGITSQPKFLVLATILSLNVGLTVLVARRKGANDKETANRLLRQSVVVSVFLSFVLTSIGYIFAKEILLFAGAGSDYINLAIEYFRIVMIGTFFYAISLTLTAAQRGSGNTKISLKTNLSANIVNFVFNAILIYGLFFFPALGVKGAAIATAMGNVVALCIALHSVLKKDGFLYLEFKKIKLYDKEMISQLFQITKSTFIEQIFIRVGFLLYSKSVAGLGTIAFSAHQVVMSIMQISFACGDGLQVATTSLVGQNLGAKRSDIAIIYSKYAQRVGLMIGIIMATVIFVFRNEIMYLFIQDPAVISSAQIPITIFSFTLIFQIVQVITVGSLRGGGDVRFVAKMMFFTVTFVRPGLTYLLAYTFGFGLPGAWISVFLDQIIRFLLSKNRFNSDMWYQRNL